MIRIKKYKWGTLHSALLSIYLNTKCTCGGKKCAQCKEAIKEAKFALKNKN